MGKYVKYISAESSVIEKSSHLCGVSGYKMQIKA